MEKKYDILFFIAHMGKGGSQRVTSNLLNYWADKNKRICLITLIRDKPDSFKLRKEIDRIIFDNKPSTSILKNITKALENKYNLVPNHQSLKSREKLNRNLKYDYFKKNLKRCILIPFYILLKLNKYLYRHIGVKLAQIIIGKFNISDDLILKYCSKIYFLLFIGDYRRIRRIRNLVANTEHQCVISFLGATNIKTIIACCGIKNSKIIISERNDPNRQKLDEPWEFLRRKLYKYSDVVTANSYGAIDALKNFVPEKKLAYVPNPLTFDIECDLECHKRKIILSVGRLVEQKAIDLLINAFSKIHKKLPDWKVYIIGDGPLKIELEELSKSLCLEDKVSFFGYKKNLTPYFRMASIYSLTSKFEGTPNALLEAMCFGMPAVVNNSSPGPLELIKHGYNGLIFENDNISDLADNIYNLAINDKKRLLMGERHRDLIQNYKIDKVAGIWESLIY
jgi:GalNAc-alpha-(1->4)-GalNAc-alpha-(1->3)-diNAcBac-PP-undecaprenol alpha-1,4-N-acetyl-D-galactosaminyltransferase